MGEPSQQPKRMKTEATELYYFKEFLAAPENNLKLNVLRNTALRMALGLTEMTVSFLRVKTEDASSFTSFAHATCDVENIYDLVGGDCKIPLVLPFGSFYKKGMQTLCQFLKEKEPAIPTDLAKRQALKDLISFLNSKSDQAALAKISESEKELAVSLGQHLIVPLAPQKVVWFDSYCNSELEKCCDGKHPIHGEVGDTSFGCLEGWHGKVDILTVDTEVPVSVVGETALETSTVRSDSSVEIEATENFSYMDKRQLLSQTIVFSFLQFNETGGTQTDYLLPSIGISAERLQVLFYDCVEDVLLETGPIELFMEDRTIHPQAVLLLWLTLNHRLFCTGIPENFKKHKSDFHRKIGSEILEMYKTKVYRKVHTYTKERKKFMHTAHIDALHEKLSIDELEKPGVDFIPLPDEQESVEFHEQP